MGDRWKYRVNCEGGTLKGAVSSCRWEMWPLGFRRCPENYINQGRFQPRKNEAERQRGFTEKPYRHPYLCANSAIFDSLSLSHSVHPYILGNKRKRKEADYIVIFQRWCFFLFYTRLKTLVEFTSASFKQLFYRTR